MTFSLWSLYSVETMAKQEVEFRPAPIPHMIFQKKENKKKVTSVLMNFTEPRPRIPTIYSRGEC